MSSGHHAICPVCTSVSTKDTEEEAQEVVDNHNEARHDGEPAQVVGPYREDLNEFMDEVKEEFDYDTYKDLGQHIVKVDPWGVL